MTAVSDPYAFRRGLRYRCAKIYLRLVAQKDSAHSIAAGLSIGLFIGLLIPMSAQLIFAIPIAMACRVSKLAAGIGTFITNPWSVIVIYPVQIYIGSFLCQGTFISWDRVSELCRQVMDLFSIAPWKGAFYSAFWDVLSGPGLHDIVLPFFAAGLLFGIIGASLGYFIMLKTVKKYRQFRHNRRLTAKNRHIASPKTEVEPRKD